MRFISGRAALGALLDNMPPVRRALIPLFTCDTVLEPFATRSIPILRYRVDEQLAPLLPDDASADDLLLLTQYFGLTHSQIAQAASEFPGLMIVDAATALYSPPLAGIPCFYSPRKFCAAPTGGIALAPFPLATLPATDTRDWNQWMQSQTHHNHQMQVLRSERALHLRAERLSLPDSAQLDCFDWQADALQRLRNFKILHERLAEINRFPLPAQLPDAPMCYPLLSGIPNLRDDLADAGLPLPLFWPEVIRRTHATDWENYLARNLLPLPLGSKMTHDQVLHMANLVLGT